VVARQPAHAPLPPVALPPARTVVVPGRGEFFLRDTAPEDRGRPVVMLLHGWLVSADLNWSAAYAPLHDAGHRVLALDHRGHGRGLRAMERFRLGDCAGDAAAVLRALDVDRAIVVGYSLGGTVAQLMARDHREVVDGIVLCATSQHFQDPETVGSWRWMGLVGLGMRVAPRTFWRRALRRSELPVDAHSTWWQCELQRHSARDMAEAGRELGRFDSRPWLAAIDVPAAVVLTGRDRAVTPDRQRELAAAASASIHEVALDHLDIATRAEEFNPALLQAVAAISASGSLRGRCAAPGSPSP